MGQGTSKYRKIMRTPQTGENAGKKLCTPGGGTSQGAGGGTDGGGDNVSL